MSRDWIKFYIEFSPDASTDGVHWRSLLDQVFGIDPLDPKETRTLLKYLSGTKFEFLLRLDNDEHLNQLGNFLGRILSSIEPLN